MAGIGIVVLGAGYSVFYYGLSQIGGGNWGFLDLIVPGRWAGAAATPKDGGVIAADSATTGQILASGGAVQNKLNATTAQQGQANEPDLSQLGTGVVPVWNGWFGLPGGQDTTTTVPA